MNTPQYKELSDAVSLLRQLPGADKELDYTLYSVKILDYVLADSYQNGKLRKPDGKFAKYEGRLTLGMAGYITQVVLKNTNNTQVKIDPADEKWYMHFKLVGETGYSIQPAQLVLQRAQKGEPASLHPFILAAIKKFDLTKDKVSPYKDNAGYTDEPAAKPWWKFW
jgi:hypothetical protein